MKHLVEAGRKSLPGSLSEGLRTLHPAYFALVMATGIVSIAAELLDIRSVAISLFWFNTVAYPILWMLFILRFILHSAALKEDFLNHNRCVGFFTLVAASCILANQCLVIYQFERLAFALGLWGLTLWVLFTYSIFTVLTVKESKPPLEGGINGGWLVAVVATQSVSIITTQLAMARGKPEPLLLLALVMWLGGGMLYIWMISLIFYRHTFFHFSPSDLSPPYWINMGAVAISTLAGTILIEAAPGTAFLTDILPFLQGFTFFFWATACWWIPMLITLGVWRHLVQRFPLRYDPLYWGAVFPLGMYAVSTFKLALAMDLPFLMWIPQVFFVVALVAWSVTGLGLALALYRQFRLAY